MRKNGIAGFFKGYAVVNGFAGFILGVIVAGSSSNQYSGNQGISFLVIAGGTMLTSTFIYAIGEVIQLLEDIKQNTSTSKSNTAESENVFNNVTPIEQSVETRIDPNGHETRIYTNGNKYIGEMKNGFRNGQGTMVFLDGTKQTGEWKNDIFKG